MDDSAILGAEEAYIERSLYSKDHQDDSILPLRVHLSTHDHMGDMIPQGQEQAQGMCEQLTLML